MPQIVQIIAAPGVTSPGPYNVYYDSITPSNFITALTLAQFLTGTTISVPDTATNITIQNANAACGNYQIFPISLVPVTFPPTPAPTTAAPTTAPTTAPTVAPTTAAPTTAPTTAAPTTAPVTAAPTTAAPTTSAPTTAAPTTPSPTTSFPSGYYYNLQQLAFNCIGGIGTCTGNIGGNFIGYSTVALIVGDFYNQFGGQVWTITGETSPQTYDYDISSWFGSNYANCSDATLC
jgi:hypothetical protein